MGCREENKNECDRFAKCAKIVHVNAQIPELPFLVVHYI